MFIICYLCLSALWVFEFCFCVVYVYLCGVCVFCLRLFLCVCEVLCVLCIFI